MKIKIDLVKGGKKPDYKTEGSVGADCYARLDKRVVVNPYGTAVIPLGFKVEIPKGFEIQVRPRSGLASKLGIFCILGTIDDDYRGEVCAIIYNSSNDNFIVSDGDRIAQIVLSPVYRCEWEEDELSDTERGEDGFGSTGVSDDKVVFYEPFRHGDLEIAESYLNHRVEVVMDGGVFEGTFVEVKEIPTVVGKALSFIFRNEAKDIFMDAFRAFQCVKVDGHRFGKPIPIDKDW